MSSKDSRDRFEAEVDISQSEVAPERGLLWGVLQRAIGDVCGAWCKSQEQQQNAREAREWLHLDHVLRFEDFLKPLPFSFVWVCYHLDLDPTIMKDAIKAQIEKETRERLWARIRKGRGRRTKKTTGVVS